MNTYVVSGNYLHRTVTEALVSGTIGAEMKFIWDGGWQALSKIVTFRAGDETADVVISSEDTTESAIGIPAAVLSAPGELCVGVYGTDGEDVALTVWSAGQRILQGGGAFRRDAGPALHGGAADPHRGTGGGDAGAGSADDGGRADRPHRAHCAVRGCERERGGQCYRCSPWH